MWINEWTVERSVSGEDPQADPTGYPDRNSKTRSREVSLLVNDVITPVDVERLASNQLRPIHS